MIDTRLVHQSVVGHSAVKSALVVVPDAKEPEATHDDAVSISGKTVAEPEPEPKPEEPATQPVREPFGPLPVDVRVPVLLRPVAHALGRHWDFLYSRVDPARPTPDPNKVWCDRQTEATSAGIDQALAGLRERGHEKGTGKVAVLGGGYEVNLAPLLEEFAEVHVVDLSDKPFPVVERQNANDPHRDRLKFIQTDLCGVDPVYQGMEVERLRQDRESGKSLDVDGVKSFMGNLPELSPSALESGAYTMVVAPVLTESMPYGPLLTDVEARRDQATAEAGIDDSQDRRSTWKHVSSILPEDFYFDPQVRQGFDKLFLHQSREVDRLLEPGGVGVTSFWTRPDERQAKHAPDEPAQLYRLGDNTVTGETFESFFRQWGHQEVTQAKIYGPDKAPTVHVYSLEKPR